MKKEVTSKYAGSATEHIHEAKKAFLNISKAVLVSPSVISASPPPSSPLALGASDAPSSTTETVIAPSSE